ncbi:hypothetical protein V490_01680 [Pseudogymnoascus sp. VKM F-3557]|nr:hypothetical protein V490_01680 [Pseudogymnoascus sp. VKM F-3557]
MRTRLGLKKAWLWMGRKAASLSTIQFSSVLDTSTFRCDGASPDLSNSITTRPHPFCVRLTRSSKHGVSTGTAIESLAPRQDHHDLISRHTTNDIHDVEGQQPTRCTRENDPYQIAASYKTASELDLIRSNTCEAKAGDHHLKYQIAVYGSFAANIILAGLQLYGAISSGSLSLFTTMADAILIPCPTSRRFGTARIETVGNIAFCFIMTAMSFILVAFSVRELAVGQGKATKNFHLPSVIAVAAAFCAKLGLFLYCWSLKNKYSQINILWQDHRNDLFINGFGILTSVGGSKLAWWVDPMGAIILFVLVTAFSEFQLLVGVTAPIETQQHITYICLTQSPDIQAIDTVWCFERSTIGGKDDWTAALPTKRARRRRRGRDRGDQRRG